MLSEKRILYIGASFFKYEIEIKRELELLGAEVDFYDDRPSNSFLSKVLLRLNIKFLIRKRISNHYYNILNNIVNKAYDYVFIVNPEALDENYLTKMKDIQKDALFILYIWDALNNKPNTRQLLKYFDKVFTFDKEDSNEFNLRFLALFYIEEYNKINKQSDFKYDICFIGTAHSDRYKVVQEIKEIVRENDMNVFTFFYLQSSIMYWVRKIFIRNYGYGNIEDFSFTPLSQEEIIAIIEQSRIVLDINHPLQSGLTSRTLETLGAKRKLITTNRNVIEYNFYDNDNIQIFDRKNIKINLKKLKLEHKNIKADIYESYSLKEWVKNIFNEI
jgi:hypothetical protein